MTMSGADVNSVKLESDTVWIYNEIKSEQLFDNLNDNDRAKQVFLFNIKNLTLVQKKPVDWKKGLKMELELKRGFSAELMQTYLPSLGLLLCTFITTKFKREFFGENVGVNLTLMLLIFTMFTAKFAELPPTQYIKMIDVWLIFCMLVPFAEVVLITMVEHYTEDDSSKAPNNTLDNTSEVEPIEDIQTVVSSTGSNRASGPAWLSRSTSLVSPSKDVSDTVTMDENKDTPVIHVCEDKNSCSHGENPAAKENFEKDKINKTRLTRWTKEGKLQICETIGRSVHEREFPWATVFVCKVRQSKIPEHL